MQEERMCGAKDCENECWGTLDLLCPFHQKQAYMKETAEWAAENARLRRKVERLVAGYPKAFKHGWMYGHTAPLAVESGKTTDEMVEMTWTGSVPQKELDAILADEPGETE